MKIKIILFGLATLCILILTQCNQEDSTWIESPDELIDIERENYFDDAPNDRTLRGLDVLKHNDAADYRAALGRRLFYETTLSLNNSISCASCHQQSKAFADGLQFSSGLFNEKTTRNSMALVNCLNFSSFFWDTRAWGLDQTVLMPIENHVEMGIRNIDDIREKLNESEYYRKLFGKAFTDRYDENHDIQTKEIAEALADFVASIISYRTKFDKGQEVHFSNFTASELRGKDLFFGKAKCDHCHSNSSFTRSWEPWDNIGLDMEYADQGSGDGIFKIPSLRNIALTAPYMHDGRFETLEEVVEHYNSGVQNHPRLAWALRDFSTGGPQRLGLTDEEKKDLVAFMGTLTDWGMMSDPRYTNPF